MFNASRSARLWIPCIAMAILAKPLFAFDLQIQEASRSVAAALVQGGKTRVAVVDFTDIEGRPSRLGRFLAEELSVALVSAAVDFEVVDRLHLQTILSENEIQRAGVFDRDTTRKLLELTAVDALVTGRLTPSSTGIRMTVKVLDTGSASLLGAVSASIERDDFLDELLAVSASDVLTTPPLPQALAGPAVGPNDTTGKPAEPDSGSPLAVAEPTQSPTPPQAPAISAPLSKRPGEESTAAAVPPLAPPTTAPDEDDAPDVASGLSPSASSLDPAVLAPVSVEPSPPQTSGIGIPIPEPMTVSVRALRIFEGSIEVTLAIDNNTSAELQWREGGNSQLSDSEGKILACADCQPGVDDSAVPIPARAHTETKLRFTPDSRAAALRKRDAFAFFFKAGTQESGSFAGPFTLFLEYELLGLGDTEPRRSKVVFTDLPAEAALEPVND